MIRVTPTLIAKLNIAGLLSRRWPSVLVSCLFAPTALACSTFAIGPDDNPLIAYSYDVSIVGSGYIFVNPSQAERSSIMEGSTARWDVNHGSVTFNQMGLGMPTVGINTMGLVVSLMWNDDVIFPSIIDSAIVNELELIQMVLDRAASVDEAAQLFDGTSVQALVPIHYFIADAAGATAIVTPTRGGMQVHIGDDMPIRALTNSSYEVLLRDIEGYAGFGGSRPLPPSSLDHEPSNQERFALAASAANQRDAVAVDDAFDALLSVQNAQTRWQVVFDPRGGIIHFAFPGDDRRWQIDMAQVDFACSSWPRGQSLDDLSTPDNVLTFPRLHQAGLVGTLTTVLDGFVDTIGLPADIAEPLAQAQLHALHCNR